jgi:MreB/Mrl family cell shape determining protein
MKLRSLLESKLAIKVKNLEGKRYFFEATRTKEVRTWLNAHDDSAVCEATVDVNDDEAYINRIDSHSRNEGNGSELLEYIIDYMKKNYNLMIGEKTAEDVKITIGSAVPLEDELAMTVKGRDCITGLPRSVEVKTNEIVRAISKELREMLQAIKEVLQETPPELASDIIDQGIIMTGGSSLLRNLADLVLRRTGVKATIADKAIFCVAMGTGIALEHLDTYKKTVISKR